MRQKRHGNGRFLCYAIGAANLTLWNRLSGGWEKNGTFLPLFTGRKQKTCCGATGFCILAAGKKREDKGSFL